MIGYTWFGTWYVFSYPEDTVFPQYWLSFTAIVFSVYTIRHFISGRRISRRVEDWNEDYLEQSYILVFNTSIPKGETTAERILTLASSIFPQLRSDYKDLSFGYTDRIKSYFKRKFRVSKASSDLSKYIDRAVGSYFLDLALKTEDGYFIVKDFNDKVFTLEDLKQLVQIIRTKFKDKYQRPFIFRVLCVAKVYDGSFLNTETLEKQMKELSAGFKIDLLKEENVGYSVLWVS
jgi:hypothetical protein